MKTVSINVMNLCVPCENRCRYCLLSYSGKTTGVDFNRSTAYARRFHDWLQVHRPDLSFLFGFGYSMEHPELTKAIQFCQSIGSPTGEFLQFDGMKFRTDEELAALLSDLKTAGIKLIDLTFYGTESYHDRFAGRQGDFNLMINTLKQAKLVGLDAAVSIPLTHENADQIDSLLHQLEAFQPARMVCFIPHCEGRGYLLDPVRLTSEDYSRLSNRVKGLLNTDRFKPEGEWVRSASSFQAGRRILTVTLTPDNIDFFEQLSFEETISYLEKLDDDYYQAIPDFRELLDMYGNPEGTMMYSARDLSLHYQRRYIAEHNLSIYDVNDERQCFSRRV